MFVKRTFVAQGQKPSKVLVILELRNKEEWGDTRPSLVLMLQNGHCVVLGGSSPLITYFPDWSGVAFFNDVKLDDYDANDPADYELPDEWDTNELPLGPQ